MLKTDFVSNGEPPVAKAAGTLDQFAAGEIDPFGFAKQIGVLGGMLDEQALQLEKS